MQRKELKIAPVVGLANDTEWLQFLKTHLEREGLLKDVPLSIIMPYYKRPKTLRQTLNSLSRSNYDLSLIECIIVDDGSPKDLSPQNLNYPFETKVLWQEDLGYRISAARNLGVQSSSHDNIIILDCDLAVNPNFLRNHANILQISRNVISVGLRDSYKVLPEATESEFLNVDPEALGEKLSEDWRIRDHLAKNDTVKLSNSMWRLCSGGNLAFRKELYERVGPFEERFTFWGGEDFEWAYRAYLEGMYFYINESANAYHFECHSSEFQIDRSLDSVKKETLLKSLVPKYKKSTTLNGEIPYISLILTLYNKITYLNEALSSIRASTDARIEVLIFDDGSTDTTLDDIKSRIPNDISEHTFIYQNPSNLGLEQTLKNALEVCKGEYICLLDADDVLEPKSIDTLVYSLERSYADLAYGRYRKLKDGNLENGWFYPICDRERSMLRSMHTHPLRVFRSRTLKRCGGFRLLDLKGAIDFSLCSQLLLCSIGIVRDTNTYMYRQVETSISNSNFEAQVEGTEKVVRDNASKLTHMQTYKVSKISERAFRVDFDNPQQAVYLAHLGLLQGEDLIRTNIEFVVHPESLRQQALFDKFITRGPSKWEIVAQADTEKHKSLLSALHLNYQAKL